ncbi:MAG: 5-formyltetrahydrofolate cyclo-ligase [Verrucomicrobiota bacterium]
MNKKRQREELKRIALLNHTADPRAVVQKLLQELERLPNARIVAAYMALPGEVDLRELFGRTDKEWVFPRVRGENLNFYPVKNIDEDMQIGAFGILEPREGLEEVAVDDVDVFLCPGLGFDRHGGRLGRGRGFYDRMLKQAKPEAVKIGVCYPSQIVDDIVMEAHDIRMDLVIW